MFSRFTVNGTKSNELKSQQRKFKLGSGRNFLMKNDVQHWKGLVASPASVADIGNGTGRDVSLLLSSDICHTCEMLVSWRWGSEESPLVLSSWLWYTRGKLSSMSWWAGCCLFPGQLLQYCRGITQFPMWDSDAQSIPLKRAQKEVGARASTRQGSAGQWHLPSAHQQLLLRL